MTTQYQPATKTIGHCGRSGFLPSSDTSIAGGSGTGPSNNDVSSPSCSSSGSYFPLYVGAGGGGPAALGGSSVAETDYKNLT